MDDKFFLNDEEKNRAKKWVEDHLQGELTCWLCKNKSWQVSDQLVRLSVFTPGVTLLGGVPEYPQIQMICSICGTTQLINAMIAGVHKEEPVAPPEKEASND